MLKFRFAQPEDCDVIAGHVRDLARDINVPVSPRVTGDDLRHFGFGENPMLLLWVAESGRGIIASGIANLIYSTWRGQPGIYVVDLYVEPEARGGRVGEKLLRAMARDAWSKGARYIRLDVDRNNYGAARFYERAGFHVHQDDRTFALDAPGLEAFLKGD